jgi:hypothetical protein
MAERTGCQVLFSLWLYVLLFAAADFVDGVELRKQFENNLEILRTTSAEVPRQTLTFTHYLSKQSCSSRWDLCEV